MKGESWRRTGNGWRDGRDGSEVDGGRYLCRVWSVLKGFGPYRFQKGFRGGASQRKVPKPTRTTKRKRSGRIRGYSLERIPSAKPHSSVILDSAFRIQSDEPQSSIILDSALTIVDL